jgi:hypothetical protein
MEMTVYRNYINYKVAIDSHLFSFMFSIIIRNRMEYSRLKVILLLLRFNLTDIWNRSLRNSKQYANKSVFCLE